MDPDRTLMVVELAQHYSMAILSPVLSLQVRSVRAIIASKINIQLEQFSRRNNSISLLASPNSLDLDIPRSV